MNKRNGHLTHVFFGTFVLLAHFRISTCGDDGYVDATVVTAEDPLSALNEVNERGGTDCVSPPHPGFPKCTGWRPQFYYKASTKSCEVFTFSGCGGNGNRFETRFLCEEVCIRGNKQAAIKALEGGSGGDDEQEVTSTAGGKRVKRQKAGFKLPVDYKPDDDEIKLEYYGAANPEYYRPYSSMPNSINSHNSAGFKLPVTGSGAGAGAGGNYINAVSTTNNAAAAAGNSATNYNRRPVSSSSSLSYTTQLQSSNNNYNNGGLRNVLNRLIGNLFG